MIVRQKAHRWVTCASSDKRVRERSDSVRSSRVKRSEEHFLVSRTRREIRPGRLYATFFMFSFLISALVATTLALLLPKREPGHRLVRWKCLSVDGVISLVRWNWVTNLAVGWLKPPDQIKDRIPFLSTQGAECECFNCLRRPNTCIACILFSLHLFILRCLI